MLKWKKSKYGNSESLDLGSGLKININYSITKPSTYELYINGIKSVTEFQNIESAKQFGIDLLKQTIEEWVEIVKSLPTTDFSKKKSPDYNSDFKAHKSSPKDCLNTRCLFNKDYKCNSQYYQGECPYEQGNPS